jgi:hypothetical protein
MPLPSSAIAEEPLCPSAIKTNKHTQYFCCVTEQRTSLPQQAIDVARLVEILDRVEPDRRNEPR